MPEERGKIVGGRSQGALPYVPALRCDVVVEVSADEFQLRVIDDTGGIGPGDQAGLHMLREGGTPDDRNRACGDRAL